MTIFAGTGIAQTFDYQPGDISYIPTAYGERISLYVAGSQRSDSDVGHFVENTGNTPLRFLEIFNSDRYQDVSLNHV